MLSRSATITAGIAVVGALLVAALTLAAKTGQAQPRAPEAQAQPGKDDLPGGKRATATKKPLLILEEKIDVDKFGASLSLKDALGVLQKDLADRGMELDIIVDADAFKELNPDAPDVFDTQVRISPIARKLTVATLLRQMLNKVATGNASFLVFRDYVLVTTVERSGIESLLLQKVGGVYDNRPLAQLLSDLAEKTAVTIVLDKRAAEKANSPISVTFQRDSTLAGALRVVTEQVDLKVVLLDGVIYVTTPVHAEQLRKDQKQLEKDRYVLWSISEFLNPRQAEPIQTWMPLGPGMPGMFGVPSPDAGPRDMPTPVDGPSARRKEAGAAS
jgi:hypothetical protein